MQQPTTRGGTTFVPKARYTSAPFAALEAERLWPRVWQIACSVDHVAEPGDWFELRSGRLSVLVVRGDDGLLRAFQNACRHRGNAICRGSGSGAKELRCPYHRWSWDLRGRLRGMPSRHYFGELRTEDLPLVAADHTEEAWAGMKQRFWDLPTDVQESLMGSLEEMFRDMFVRMKVGEPDDLLARFMQAPVVPVPLPAPLAQVLAG